MVVSTLMRFVRWLLEFVLQWFRKRTGTVITLDTGKRVVMGKQIAEGGFSFVFEAFDADYDNNSAKKTKPQRGNQKRSNCNSSINKYALKRIHCPDPELLRDCRREAAVHRAVQHPNVMPLLGFAVLQTDCYMLFPYCSQSLRDAVNRRNPLLHNFVQHHAAAVPSQAPWAETTALNLFLKICAGVQALHESDYSHRDIKLENVLLLEPSNQLQLQQQQQQQEQYYYPVLMDLGSAGPTVQAVTARRHVLELVEQAAQHTTLPYRPPELFEGGITLHNSSITGPDTDDTTVLLDYRAVDVWSLGCTLHAILYGASPFECEFTSAQRGSIKIVECTHLSVLGNLPTPLPPVSSWYSKTIRTQLLEPMLSKDRFQRPTVADVMSRVKEVIRQLGGSVDDPAGVSSLSSSLEEHRRPFQDDDDGDDDNDEKGGIALMSRVV